MSLENHEIFPTRNICGIRYRITASRFGEILRRRSTTSPDWLVLSIINHRPFSSVACDQLTNCWSNKLKESQVYLVRIEASVETN